MKRPMVKTWVISLCLGLPAAARPIDRFTLDAAQTFSLPISRSTQVVCGTSSDGVTAELRISAETASNRLIKLGSKVQLGPYTLRLAQRYPHDVVGSIDGPSGIIDCVVETHRSRRVLRVGRRAMSEVLALLQASVLRKPPIQLRPAEVKPFAEAERRLATGQFELAAAALSATSPWLSDYLLLRKADIELLAGQVHAAYLHYRELAAVQPGSALGFVALVRSSALAHLVEGLTPPNGLVQLASNPALGNIARYALSELAELLLRARRAEDVLALAQIHGKTLRQLAQQALLLALRRSLWADQPYRAAIIYDRARELRADHPERWTVSSLAAQAYLELGLPNEAAQIWQHNIDAANTPGQTEETLRSLAVAFLEAGNWQQSLDTVSTFLARYRSTSFVPTVQHIGMLARLHLDRERVP